MEAGGAVRSEQSPNRGPESLGLEQCQSGPGLLQPVPPQSLAPRQLATILSLPPQSLAPRRPRSSIYAGPTEDEVSLRSPDIPKCRSLFDQVELRRSLFQEARAFLRHQDLHCGPVLPVSSPFDKIRRAASAVLKGAHVVLMRSKVVAALKGAAKDSKKKFSNIAGVKDEKFKGAADSVDSKSEEGFDNCDVDALLVEFEIMSDLAHIHSLEDYKNFQQNARQMISKVHSSIAMLLNLHDSVSMSMDDSVKLRAQFHECAMKAQELWDKIKDDVERIRKLLHPCDDVAAKQEPLKPPPKPFLKIIEHSLESLGIMRQSIEMQKESDTLNGDSMDARSGNFKMELQSALGGGSYQRLSQWGNSLSELRGKKSKHFDRGGEPLEQQCNVDCSNELDEHLLAFLEECKGSMSDSEVERLKIELMQTRDVDTNSITYRRFLQHRAERPILETTSVTSDANHELPCLLGSVESTSSDMKLNPAIKRTESTNSSLDYSPRSIYTPTTSTRVDSNPSTRQTSNASELEVRLLLEHHESDQACDRTLHVLEQYCEDASLFCAATAEHCRDSSCSPVQSLSRKSPACSGASLSEISESSTQESLPSQTVTLSHRGRCFSRGVQPPNEMAPSLVPKPPAERRKQNLLPCLSSLQSVHLSPDAFNLELVEGSVEELYSPEQQKPMFLMTGQSLSNGTASTARSLSRDKENSLSSFNSPPNKPDGDTSASISRASLILIRTSRANPEATSREANLAAAPLELLMPSVSAATSRADPEATSKNAPRACGVKLPNVFSRKRPRSISVHTAGSVVPTSSARCLSSWPLTSEQSGKEAMSRWEGLKNSIHLPTIVGNRRSSA